MNAVLAPSITIIAKGYGEAPRSSATDKATGAISTAVAVLEMNIPRIDVTPKMLASARRGEASPITRRIPSAGMIASDIPISCDRPVKYL